MMLPVRDLLPPLAIVMDIMEALMGFNLFLCFA